MSKERLETSYVIETVKREVVIAKGTNNTRNIVNLPIDLVLVLIKQAERVQELERVNKQLKNNLSVYKGYYKNMIKINEDIVEENKRYREAIIEAMKLNIDGDYNYEVDKLLHQVSEANK